MAAIFGLSTFWWFTIAFGLAALGCRLVWLGWRGRQVGEAPSCRKCAYALVGVGSDRCPECGADLTATRAVNFGQRRRRPASVALGLMVVLFAAGVLVAAANAQRLRHYDWYALKPTGFLLDDLADPGSPDRLRAWREIEKRVRLGQPLDAGQRKRLATIALTEQASPVASYGSGGYDLAQRLFGWLQEEAAAGRLGPEDRARFFERLYAFQLAVRPYVVAGEAAPFAVSREDLSLKQGNPGPWRYWTRVTQASAGADGAAPRVVATSDSPAGLGGLVGAITGSLPVETVGRHELAVTLHVEVRRDPPSTTGAGKWLHEYDVTLKRPIEVVADLPANARAVRMKDGGALAGRVRQAIRLGPLRITRGKSPALAGSVSLVSPPIDVAFAVVARAGGKEYPLGRIAHPMAEVAQYPLRCDPYDGPADLEAVDLVFRADDVAARQVVSITQFWGGELVFEGVPVDTSTDRLVPWERIAK